MLALLSVKPTDCSCGTVAAHVSREKHCFILCLSEVLDVIPTNVYVYELSVTRIFKVTCNSSVANKHSLFEQVTITSRIVDPSLWDILADLSWVRSASQDFIRGCVRRTLSPVQPPYSALNH
jgi:hypothetical protein